MTSIKVKFRPPSVPGLEGKIFFQVIHERKTSLHLSDYRIFSDEWDKKRSMVRPVGQSDRKEICVLIKDQIRQDVERLRRIVVRLDKSDLEYSSEDVIEAFLQYKKDCSLFNYMNSIIDRLRQNGNIRTSETYTSTLNSFRRYRGDKDVMMDSITAEMMEDYQAWNLKRGLTMNTSSFYMRILRAVYNRAVDCELIDNRNPFRRVYTGVDKTVKRALPIHTIRKVKELDLSLYPGLDYARDMFIMSFYLRGMSFIDMAFLKKTDLAGGYVTYRRRKTNQTLRIEWTMEMQTLLDKYPSNMSEYLLPIIRNPGTNERCTYHNVGYTINRNLKSIAKLLDIPVNLSLYVARHSWASAAKEKGIPISVISEGMGHDSELTTRIYLASLETSVIDRANSIIIGSI